MEVEWIANDAWVAETYAGMRRLLYNRNRSSLHVKHLDALLGSEVRAPSFKMIPAHAKVALTLMDMPWEDIAKVAPYRAEIILRCMMPSLHVFGKKPEDPWVFFEMPEKDYTVTVLYY